MKDPTRPPVVPEIEGLLPYIPGKPVDELKRELGLTRAVKLASNENPLGPSPLAVEAMREALAELHFYPDGGAFYLKQRLAEHLGVQPSEVLVANGSNEALELIVRTFRWPGCRAVVSAHSFIVYKMASIAANVIVDEVPMTPDLRFDLEAMAERIGDETRFIFLANPNNPTGTWFDRASLVRLLERVPPDVLVVLDEAYFEFVEAPQYPDGVALWREYPNLIVLRTFSKCYGLAGLRIGYGVLSSALNRYIDRVRAPFNTNLLAQRAAVAALGDDDFLARSIAHNRRTLVQLTDGMRRLGLHPVESVTNFVLVELPRPAQEIFEALLERGVIVRPMGGYGLPYHIRVSVGLEEEIGEFLSALGDVMTERRR